MSVRLAITLVSYFGETHRVRVLQPTPIIGHLPAARLPRPPAAAAPPAAILPAFMAPPICLLLAAAPLATALRPEAIAVQSCIQSWRSAPGSRQPPPEGLSPPAHLPAFDAIIKQRYAAISQALLGRNARAPARRVTARTPRQPCLQAPTSGATCAPPAAGAGKSALWWLGAGAGLTRRFDTTQHTSRAHRRDSALSRRSDLARIACLLGASRP